jgi:hypothetical protein
MKNPLELLPQRVRPAVQLGDGRELNGGSPPDRQATPDAGLRSVGGSRRHCSNSMIQAITLLSSI